MPESISIGSSFDATSKLTYSNRNNDFKLSKRSLNKDIQPSILKNSPPPENEISDQDLIKILNKFIFLLFLLFIIFLNIFGLIVFPYIIQTPLSIDG